jgi:hypothetical protein
MIRHREARAFWVAIKRKAFYCVVDERESNESRE